MGLFETRWEADVDHRERRISVVRNEWTKGISVHLDGTKVASKAWSWIGLARVAGSVDLGGRPARIEVTIRPGSVCELVVDGQRLPATRAR